MNSFKAHISQSLGFSKILLLIKIILNKKKWFIEGKKGELEIKNLTKAKTKTEKLGKHSPYLKVKLTEGPPIYPRVSRVEINQRKQEA